MYYSIQGNFMRNKFKGCGVKKLENIKQNSAYHENCNLYCKRSFNSQIQRIYIL